MAIEIREKGLFLEILTNGIGREISKLQIKEIAVVKDMVALHYGENKILVKHRDVFSPFSANADQLRETISDMIRLDTATIQNQLLQLTELQSVNTKLDEIKTKLDTINSTLEKNNQNKSK